MTWKLLLISLSLAIACGDDATPILGDASADVLDVLDASDSAPDLDASHDAGDECVAEVIVPPSLLPECPDCTGARCVAGDELTTEQREGLRACSSSHVCMPDEYLLTGGNFTPITCEAAFGAEGRCLSACLPGVFETRDALARAGCPDTHRCVPCFDPFDGSDTGACEVGCDTGPTSPPTVLPSCCDDLAVCIPTDDVPPAGRPYFESCETGLCVPRPIAGNVGYVAPSCTVEALRDRGEEQSRGICAHTCQAGLDDVRELLAQDDCEDEFLCVPCYDPADGSWTGACLE